MGTYLDSDQINWLANFAADKGFGAGKKRQNALRYWKDAYARIESDDQKHQQVKNDLLAMDEVNFLVDEEKYVVPLLEWLKELEFDIGNRISSEDSEYFKPIIAGVKEHSSENINQHRKYKEGQPGIGDDLEEGSLGELADFAGAEPEMQIRDELRITVVGGKVEANSGIVKGSFTYGRLQKDTVKELQEYGEKISALMEAYKGKSPAEKQKIGQWAGKLDDLDQRMQDGIKRLVRVYGGYLFEALFNNDKIRERLDDALKNGSEKQPVRLVIQIKDKELQPLLWESLYDYETKKYLVRDERLVLVLQRSMEDKPVPKEKSSKSLRIMMVPPEIDYKDNQTEIEHKGIQKSELLKIVESAAATLKNHQLIIMTDHTEHDRDIDAKLTNWQKSKNMAWLDYGDRNILAEAISDCKPDVIHFICRAEDENIKWKSPGGRSQNLTATTLGNLFRKARHKPEVMLLQVFNSKQVKDQKTGINDTSIIEFTEMNMDLAGIVPILVGMLFGEHTNAKVFSQEIYRLLNSGHAVDVAVQQARLIYFDETNGDELEAIPILSMTTTDGEWWSGEKKDADIKAKGRSDSKDKLETLTTGAPLLRGNR